MYFYNLIEKMAKDEKIIIYVDMDGVIASYDFGRPLDFANKRPLMTNIKTLEKVNCLKNVELHILSVCRKKREVKDKNEWLDKYAKFFDKDKRIILDKESNPTLTSKELKLNYLKTLNYNDKVIFIDDDNEVLRFIRDNLKDIILFQDSELID